MYNATTKNTNYLHYPLAAVESLSLPCLVVLGVICALTKDGKQTCDLSNKEIQHRTGIRKSAATSAISELIKQKLIKVDISHTKNGGQKRTITLLTDAKLFSEQVNRNTADGSTAKQPTLDAKKDEDLPQNGKRVCRNTADGSTAKQPTPYRNTVDPYIYEEGRSKVERKVDLKGMNNSVEKSTQKTKTTEQQGSSLSENQENTDSMFLPQDLLPEELRQPELTVINSVNPLNCDADPQNIAINTLGGTNTHHEHRSPLKTKSERSESVSKKPARNRKVKNPEFDEQGNKIFYVKDNPPTLEQTVSCMQNIADKFFNNLLIDRKAVPEDIAFLDSLNLRSEAERCFEHYQSNGWVINTGDYLKNWYMTCRRWISKKIDQSWIQWERDKRFKRRSYVNNGANQRTYGETLDDFQGRVINQINRIGQGMFNNQTPELEYGQQNLLNNGGNQRK